MQYKSKGKRDQCKSGNCPPVDIVLTEYDEFDDYLEMVIQFGVSKRKLKAERRKERGCKEDKEGS